MLFWLWASLIAQLVKNPPAMQETRFDSSIRKICWRRERLPTPVFLGFPCGSVGKESTCNAGDPGSIPELGWSPGEGKGYPLQYSWASLVAQLGKNPPAMCETWVRSVGREDPLEKGKATYSSILAWRILWTIQSIYRAKLPPWKIPSCLLPVNPDTPTQRYCCSDFSQCACFWGRFLFLSVSETLPCTYIYL